ncbi:hypothetical protein ACH0BF_02295 [Pseudobacillus sp. 179-B 2D1 NHS]|uniref:hypothetical protein n=1 Tax=Pseudobacillus sp. 179-B 2D1 NHS TaxID=3374292 RepID=UPI00387A48BD
MKKLLFLILSIMVVFVLNACGEVKESKTVESESVEAEDAKGEDIEDIKEDVQIEEEPVVEEESYDIGMTVEEFTSAFNTVSSQEFPESNLGELNISIEDGGDYNILKHQFSDSLMLMGVVNKKTGLIKDVGIGIDGFNNDSDFLNHMIISGILVAVTNPDLSAEERGSILMNDLTAEEAVKSGGRISKVVNNIQYNMVMSKESGLWFTLNHENNPVQ